MGKFISLFRLTTLLISSHSSKNSLHKTLSICSISTTTQNRKEPTKTKTFSHIFQECSKQRAEDPGKQAHARMIISGFNPTIFVTNCLIQLYIKCFNLEYAHKVFDSMPQRDVVSWNAILFGYASCGNMEMAGVLFDEMPERDVVSWNSMISGYLQNNEAWKCVLVFLEMGRKLEVEFDHKTFAVVLKACSVSEGYDVGIQLHGLAIQKGFHNDVVTGSALVDMYGKCKRLDDSMKLFREMPEKNWVSWSTIIAGCVQNDEFIDGLNLFKEMQKSDIGVSQSTYASVFRSCAGLSELKLGTQLHAHALKTNFRSDVIVGTATLDMYAKCESVIDARKLFNTIQNPNLQSHNAMIVGYARSESIEQAVEALVVFRLLVKSGNGFDEISLSGAFRACASMKGLLEGVQVHCLVFKSRFASNVCVANSVIDMYGKCGAFTEARNLFNEMDARDGVSWNAIIAAHVQTGEEQDDDECFEFFVSMLRSRVEPDEFTYGSVLKACAYLETLNSGMEVHGRVIKSGMGFDFFVGSTLVDMYCKCGMMEEAKKIHDRTERQTMVSWNAIISGFSTRKQSEEAQRFFSRMLESGVTPDNFTYATVLDTCANLASVGLGKQIHAQIIKLELQSDVYILSTLVDMYSKCGDMEDSRLMFEKARNRDYVTWNAMICGYSQHGLGKEAVNVFDTMILENITPNHSTFVSVLRACAHMGLVEKGLVYFNSMKTDYGLCPQLEHYSCMVDLIGRSGKVFEALKLIEDMPFEADDVVWRTLLSVCKTVGNNVEVAEIAARSLLELDPQDSTAYILLSNVYADAGMWEKVSDLRKIMRRGRLKKEPGCSWIEIKDEIHAFLVADKAHPRCDEIYENLDVLISEMQWTGYSFMMIEEVEEDKAA